MKIYPLHKLSLAIKVVGTLAMTGPMSHAIFADENNGARTEEVMVTGIRNSLSTAQSIKETSTTIVDAISAEDIGKLPDQNVAESLQRITGVQIRRRNGEGSAISIRGLRDNRIEVGGATLVNPTGRNNGPNESTFNVLQFLPSQLFSGLEVSKAPTADMVEGGIGGHVQMKMRKPLDFDEGTVAYTAQGVYSEAAEDIDPRGSVLIADTFFNDTFGLLFTASHGTRSVQEDLYYTRGTEVISSASPDNEDDFFFVGNESRWQTLEEDRERNSYSLGMQWQPSDGVELYANGFVAEFDIERLRNWLSVRYGGGSEGPNFEAFDNKIISDRNTLLAAEYDTLIQGNGEENGIFSDTSSLVIGGLFEKGPLSINTEFTYGEAEQTEDQQFLRAQSLNQTRVGVDFRPSVPSVRFLDPSFDHLAPENYRNNIGWRSIRTFTNEESSGRLDVDYTFEDQVITSVEVGARYASSAFAREAARSLVRQAADANLNDIPARFNPVVSLADVFGEHPASIIGPRLSGGSGIATGPDEAWNPPPFERRTQEDVTLDEDITAFYAKANFAADLGVPVSGNIGLRSVTTKQVAKTPAIGDVDALNIEEKYTELLPSLNVRADLKEDLALRFAYSEVMSRPPTFDLLPAYSVDVVNNTASSGNPSLDPFTAKAYDLSLEWYMDDSSMTSIAFFRKEAESFLIRRNFQETIPGIDPNTMFSVSRPVNGAAGDINGIELAYQKTFDNGLGLIANYTYADGGTPNRDPSTSNGGLTPLASGSDVQRLGTPIGLEGLSENSFNLIGFYENDTISLRAAYNYRDEFVEQVESVATGGTVIQKGSGQLDLSASYHLTEHLALTFDAVNVTDTDVVQYSMFEERRYRAAETGRSFLLGVQGSFSF